MLWVVVAGCRYHGVGSVVYRRCIAVASPDNIVGWTPPQVSSVNDPMEDNRDVNSFNTPVTFMALTTFESPSIIFVSNKLCFCSFYWMYRILCVFTIVINKVFLRYEHAFLPLLTAWMCQGRCMISTIYARGVFKVGRDLQTERGEAKLALSLFQITMHEGLAVSSVFGIVQKRASWACWWLWKHVLQVLQGGAFECG